MHGGGVHEHGADIADLHAERDGTSAGFGAALAVVEQEFAVEIAQLDMADLDLELLKGVGLAAARLPANFLEVAEV